MGCYAQKWLDGLEIIEDPAKFAARPPDAARGPMV
jgi:hypothetical protein